MDRTNRIPELIQRVYSIVGELEELFPGKRFTPDGHLVGSIGEVLAAHRYGLELLPSSSEGHDAISRSGVRVQVKTTQGDTIALRSEPEHLIVLRILPDGTATEVFNGPGSDPWRAAGKVQKNGQRPVSLNRLRDIMENVPSEARLEVVGAQQLPGADLASPEP
jgi:hypothetical protein